MFNVQERSEVTTKRRKVEGGDYDDDDEVRKKQKFEIQGGSGVMTDFIRDEKAKNVGRVKDAFGVAAAIDLTGEFPSV